MGRQMVIVQPYAERYTRTSCREKYAVLGLVNNVWSLWNAGSISFFVSKCCEQDSNLRP